MTKQLVATNESSGRFDPFRLLGPDERRHHLRAYRSFLEARNGRIDLGGRSLARREQFFRALRESPVVSRNPGDRRGFQDRMRGSGSAAIDQATAWLVAVARASEGESYGVDLELAKYDRDERYGHDKQYLEPEAADEDVTQLYVFMEELYHGRLLTEICTTLGYELGSDPPHWRLRFLIHLINRMADRYRWVLMHCAEIVGSTCFKLFLDRCWLFADEPEVEGRLRWLVGEIWRDEVLHVAMLRARLGPVGMWFARRLFPLVLGALLRDVPELLEIGCGRDDFMERLRSGIEIPPHIDWLSPDPLPAI